MSRGSRARLAYTLSTPTLVNAVLEFRYRNAAWEYPPEKADITI